MGFGQMEMGKDRNRGPHLSKCSVCLYFPFLYDQERQPDLSHARTMRCAWS